VGLPLPVFHDRRCCCCCAAVGANGAVPPPSTATQIGGPPLRDDEPVWIVYDPIRNLYSGAAGFEPNAQVARSNYRAFKASFQARGYTGDVNATLYRQDQVSLIERLF
jgi:hypothetical protein